MASKHKKKKVKNVFFSRWKQQIIYAISNMLQNFRDHFFASLLTVLVIAITITLPTMGYVLLKNSNEVSEQWRPTPNLTVYLDKSLKSNEAMKLFDEINECYSSNNTVTFLSEEDTLKEFLTWSGFEESVDFLDDNPLPAAIIIESNEELVDLALMNTIKADISTLKGVDEVKIDDSWFDRIMALTSMIKTIVIGMSILMIVAVALVVSNSIRLMIFARRETINVMQFMGATQGFIMRPFLYSGMLTGFLSAWVAVIFDEIFTYKLSSEIGNISSAFNTEYQFQGLNLLEIVLILFISTLIGWISAYFSTKRYLNHKSVF